tara:strand:+ start:157 stop:741 length:585 start_codon:yes stop_codon:yes gene_type:complete
MKKLLGIVVLVLLLSLSVKADDIKEFEIEGMSIGDSLLKFYNNDRIIERIKNQPQYYKDNEYILLTFIDKTENYDGFKFHIKSDDTNYIIYMASGFKEMNFEKCNAKKNEISNQLEEMFGKNSREDGSIQKHSYDKTGNSVGIQTAFQISNGRIRVLCMDWSEKITKEKTWSDKLTIEMYTSEFRNWLNKKAYK